MAEAEDAAEFRRLAEHWAGATWRAALLREMLQRGHEGKPESLRRSIRRWAAGGREIPPAVMALVRELNGGALPDGAAADVAPPDSAPPDSAPADGAGNG